jgi:hypothetical protein
VLSRSFVLFAVTAPSLFGCATDTPPSGTKFEVSAPTESGAIPMTTKEHTKAEVLANVGTPISKRILTPNRYSNCVERWYYMGKVTVAGFGSLDIMTYVDFDDSSNVCTSKAIN